MKSKRLSSQFPGMSSPKWGMAPRGANKDDAAFSDLQRYIYRFAGIRLGDSKKEMVFGRLSKRLRYHRLDSFADYYQLVMSDAVPNEKQVLIDLLTTHETRFFREPRHYAFLERGILADHPLSRPFRVWSAACSSGEEAYSAAMVMAEHLGTGPWEVVGTDISAQVLEKARAAHYPISCVGEIPQTLLKRYCLKGHDSQEGVMGIHPALRARLHLSRVNLNAPLPNIGTFDVIFLRNVLIYFDLNTQRTVVFRVIDRLQPGGHLFLGHAESLHQFDSSLIQLEAGIYRKPE